MTVTLRTLYVRASSKNPDRAAWAAVIVAAIVWILAYRSLRPLADWLTFGLFGLAPESHLAVAFFLYDVPKILLLLSGIIFLVTVLRSFFSPEQTRRLLGGKRLGLGNTLAAGLGVITPFCSCSTVPLFIGFVESGIPLGVTFSFLIAAPMVNEVAVVMLLGLFGWQVAALYMVTGLVIAIVAGLVIGALGLERYVEDFVWQVKLGDTGLEPERLSWTERFSRAMDSTRAIVSKVWPYVVVGIAIGTAIHGFVPENALAGIMGKEAW